MRAILLLTMTVAAANAQTIEVESLFQPAPLSGTWKHHAGDDPRWADPAFDDSAWPGVHMPQAADQPPPGFSWYRFRVRLPETMPKEPLALMIGGFGNSQAWEVFWNGQRAGAMGEVDGGVWGLRISLPKSIPVPGYGRESVVAIRLRAASGEFNIPSRRTSWIGTEASTQGQIEAWRGERLRNALPMLLISASLFLSAVLFLLHPLWRRDVPEYFWFGLWLPSGIVNRVYAATPDVLGLERSMAASWLAMGALVGLALGWLGWIRTLFLGRVTGSVWLAFGADVARQLARGTFLTAGGPSPRMLYSVRILTNSYLAFVYYKVGWRSSRETDRMPFVHIAIMAYFAVLYASFAAMFFSPTSAMAIQGPFVRTIIALPFAFAMTIVMNQRSARLLGERQRLSGELASAAEVQSLLLTSLPSARRTCSGLNLSIFRPRKPAGDFYQVLECPDGSRVVLVSDVSCKGLKAAMLVSACVGILRNEESSSRGQILAALNRGLVGHTDGGFVTCCCARFDADGTVTLANAGHPSPSCDGREPGLEAGLPSDIVAGVVYGEQVVAGERFTFVSDGVVEAENTQRELFGFDRTRDNSGKSAAEIAEAAKAWGQNDDITVVTVRRNS